MVSAAKKTIVHIALVSCVALIATTGCGENNTAGNRAMNMNTNTSGAQQRVMYHVVAGGNMIMTAPQKVDVSK